MGHESEDVKLGPLGARFSGTGLAAVTTSRIVGGSRLAVNVPLGPTGRSAVLVSSVVPGRIHSHALTKEHQ
ncbi:hypothetical protein BH18ACT16_BH18ACT16_07180 [soil metagenome]